MVNGELMDEPLDFERYKFYLTRVTAMLALMVQLVWVHPEWVKRELMLSMEPRLGKMVREPYNSSTASHREYTDSTLQKQSLRLPTSGVSLL